MSAAGGGSGMASEERRHRNAECRWIVRCGPDGVVRLGSLRSIVVFSRFWSNISSLM
jgi:hypothetical protein